MNRLRSAVLLLCMAACAPLPADVATEEIVRGRPSPSDDAVVLLLGGGLCSGTVIAPRVVLTAKHCVVREGAPGPGSPTGVTVAVGESFGSLRARYAVERILTTPGPLEISGGGNPVASATGTDIALLILRRPFTEAAPIPVARHTSPDDLIGQTLLAIGYGNTERGSSGTRLEVDAVVTGTTDVLVEAIEVICQGDSGGPLIAMEDGERRVIGVASFGVYSMAGMVGQCPADADYWNRVDVQRDLIDLALRYSGECVPRGDEACNGIDDDCNGMVDEGCAGLGEACTEDANCAYGPAPFEAPDLPAPVRCVAGACSLPCNAAEPFADCAAIELPYDGGEVPLTGFVCAATSGCVGTCVRGGPGPGAPGSACSQDLDCSTLACGFGVCSTRCIGDRGTCPSDEVCIADAGACGICAGAGSRSTGRGRGEPCSNGAECSGGLCGADGTCTLACTNDDACGEGFRCGGEGECIRGERGVLGDYCIDSEDCMLGSCGVRGSGRFCASPCTTDADCEMGTCVMGVERPVCTPALAGLGESCSSDDACGSGVCRGGTCTELCNALRTCPRGTACVRSGGETLCRVPSGCAASGRANPSSPALCIVALAVYVGRRARRRGR